jgi:hypothetical protein
MDYSVFAILGQVVFAGLLWLNDLNQVTLRPLDLIVISVLPAGRQPSFGSGEGDNWVIL